MSAAIKNSRALQMLAFAVLLSGCSFANDMASDKVHLTLVIESDTMPLQGETARLRASVSGVYAYQVLY